jgi:hypothetical protein
MIRPEKGPSERTGGWNREVVVVVVAGEKGSDIRLPRSEGVKSTRSFEHLFVSITSALLTPSIRKYV